MILVLKKLKDILPPSDEWKMTVLLVLMLVAAGLEAAGISTILVFVSAVSDPERLQGIPLLPEIMERFGIESQRDLLIFGSLSLIGIFLFKNIYLVLLEYIKSVFTYNRSRYIALRLFKHYMYAPYTFHLHRNTAELIRNINNEAKTIGSGIISSLLNIATQIMITIAIIIFLFIVEPLITTIILGILGGTGWLLLKLLKEHTQRSGAKAVKEGAHIIQTLNEGLGGIKDTTVLQRQSWFVKRLERSTSTVVKAEIFRDMANRSTDRVIEIVVISSTLLIALILVLQGKEIGSAIPIVALFGASALRLMPSLSIVTGSYNSFRYYSNSLTPVHRDLTSTLYKSHFANTEPKKNKTILPFNKSIAINNISYTYPHGKKTALKDISLTIPKGSSVGIVGLSGSGKTTLIDILLGLLKPSEGNIQIDGVTIKDNIPSWQRNIGYIPQFIYLADSTIESNIAFGLDIDTINKQQLQNAIRMAQLEDTITKLPDGLKTIIGEHGTRLSGGQRQRIGIARALYHNPQLLIMDEATSSLDNQTERYVMEAIEYLKHDRTIIIIAHRLTTVQNCDILYVMNDGKVVASGKYEQLLKTSKDFKSIASLLEKE